MIPLPTLTRGGVLPDDRKSLTRGRAIWNAALPTQCVVPLHQHAGAAAEAVVSVGDRVREGMLIGRAVGRNSAHVHAPIPGVVTTICLRDVYPGRPSNCVVIDLEGEFERLGKPLVPAEWHHRGARDLRRNLRECGVVGMGGGGTPADSKFTIPRGVEIEHLIVNGAESEPYLTATHRLMLEKPSDILEGARIAAHIAGARKVTIAVGGDKRDAVTALRRLVRERGLPFAVRAVSLSYPTGDEKLLIREVIGREVPAGRQPIDLRIVVSSVPTINAVYEAIALGKPLVERVVTVAGSAIGTPSNVKVRIGTPVGALLAECGGLIETPARLVLGGPMMGYTVTDMATPITKTTTGVLALSADEVNEGERTPCIGCGRCIRVCPVGLEPVTLVKMLERERPNDAAAAGLADCRECGCCSYVCPSHIPLTETLVQGRRQNGGGGV
ncbi:MAG: electron transport complex subunit RsxC [Spirochaetaceae bacterium]|nr:MAG: electron transport complex subunit RsxC [Spirochaetaceae bacterium]